jgi:hypothetical protein
MSTKTYCAAVPGAPREARRTAPRGGDRHKIRAKTVRIDDELWSAFRRKVADEDKTMTAVLTMLIRRYLRE